ncbi:MAG TPA: phosphatase PAP2 family protein [Candidatus Paceibacterota bacterium]|nr:phosphatase PAP2 family protein [Verrucomicrobiota bacterium]HSA11128.1 phosphatase PAP2 family protein [Candidatus Paceibacterota bacterium]
MTHYTFVDYATQAYIALVGALILVFHDATVPNWPSLVGAHAAGLVVVHCLIQAHARSRRGWLLDFLRHFYPVLLYTAFFCETGLLNRMFFKDFLDPMVAQWEQQIFGCQPSVLFMERLPWLAVSELFYASYFSYYIMIVGVGVALFLRSRQQFFHYVSVVSFLFYFCYLTYIILPVIGSRAFFRQVDGYVLPEAAQQLAGTDAYPEAVQVGGFFQIMKWIYRVFEAPGAAFPSSHVAVALCTVYFSFRYLRRIRYAHLAVAFLLCLSTVYCRYHYVVDVLAGLVTAAVVIPLGSWLYFKFEKVYDLPMSSPDHELTTRGPL